MPLRRLRDMLDNSCSRAQAYFTLTQYMHVAIMRAQRALLLSYVIDGKEAWR